MTKGERPAPGDWLTYINDSAKTSDNNGFAAAIDEAELKVSV